MKTSSPVFSVPLSQRNPYAQVKCFGVVYSLPSKGNAKTENAHKNNNNKNIKSNKENNNKTYSQLGKTLLPICDWN